MGGREKADLQAFRSTRGPQLRRGSGSVRLDLSEKERRKLMRTLRWVLTATIMDVHEESMMRDILRRLNAPPIPPKPKDIP